MGNIRQSERGFLIDFLVRTKRNLNNYDNDFDMVNLINCCLGLIVFPFESKRIIKTNNSVLDQKAKDVSREIGFRFIKFMPIEDLRENRIPKRYNENKKTLRLLLEKIRNGLAHQNIKPKNNHGHFNEIVIWNEFKRGRQPNTFSEIDVRVIFTQNQLKQIALMIADSYLPKQYK